MLKVDFWRMSVSLTEEQFISIFISGYGKKQWMFMETDQAALEQSDNYVNVSDILL